ncbi:hypothetical protein BraRD5C2_68050 [Bradyrhizobium sp. RD5-C2]|nr:hypothetical protein BraRD5C2_68050 [Bradyrhizobium sp. RD5-C2]
MVRGETYPGVAPRTHPHDSVMKQPSQGDLMGNQPQISATQFLQVASFLFEEFLQKALKSSLASIFRGSRRLKAIRAE